LDSLLAGFLDKGTWRYKPSPANRFYQIEKAPLLPGKREGVFVKEGFGK
jgi:hypothetical protein